MLNTMRSGAGGWLAKLLLGLLILSFTVWGVEDMLRYGGRNAQLATVGGHEIPRAAFERALRAESEQMRAMLGANYSPELLKMLHLEHKVLQGIILRELLYLETRALGLTPSDEEVAREIRGMEAFHNEKGAFDKRLFAAVLRQQGLPEKALVEDIRRTQALQLLDDAVAAGAAVNPTMAAVTYAAEQEQRSADIAELTPSLVKDAPAPTDAEIEAYYNAHKAEFMLPEYRTVSYVTVRTDELMRNLTIPESELKSAYDERAALFGDDAEPFEKVRPTLEKEIKAQRMDEAVAEFSTKIEDALAAGDGLKEVARQFKLETGGVGPVNQHGLTPAGAKAAIPDYARFLETAFKVEENTESALIPARPGLYYLLRVDAVQPETAQPLEKVHEKAAAATRAAETAKRLVQLAEDITREMKAAKNPAAVLAQHGVKTVSSGSIRRGSQKTSTDMALPAALTAEIFALPVGSATAPYPAPGGKVLIAVVKDRKAPPRLSPEALKKDAGFAQARRQLETETREQLREEYLDYLRAKYRVVINSEALAAYAGEAQ